MNDQTLDVRNIGQQGENFQIVNELMGFLHAALDLKGEDGCAAVGEILLIQGVIRVVGQGGMVHMLHLRMVREELHHLLCVLGMALQAQGQRLNALQQQEGREGRDGRAGVPQQHRADIGHKRGGAGGGYEGNAVIAGVRLGDGGVLPGSRPVKLAGVHDDAAKGGSVAAEELGCGVDDDVRTVLDGADEVGRAEGVVHHQRNAVLVRQLGQGVDVGDVTVGVAQRLNVDGAGLGADGALHFLQIVDVHEIGGNAEAGQGVGEQVVAAAVNGLLGDKVAAVLTQRFQHVGNGRRAGGQRQRRNAAFQSSHPFFQHVLRGVGETAVNVAGVRQPEAGGGVGAVVEHVRGGGVNGNGPGIGSGVGLLLTDVELQGFKFIVRHNDYFLSSVKYYL